jgi:Leucine-rich repeat (LRR) protein
LRLLGCHDTGPQLLAAAQQLTSLTSLVVVAGSGSSSASGGTTATNVSSSTTSCRGGSMLQGMQRLSPSSKPGASSSSSTGASLPEQQTQLEQEAVGEDGTTSGWWLHGTLLQLPHLQHLALEHLPSSCVNPLTGLTALRQLALRGCGLRGFPPGVAAALTRVTHLDLSANLLPEPPMSLALLSQLEVS